jgi:hypothetical protein
MGSALDHGLLAVIDWTVSGPTQDPPIFERRGEVKRSAVATPGELNKPRKSGPVAHKVDD